MQDCTGSGLLRIDQQETARGSAFAEQTLAGADNHRELPDSKRVDQSVLQQGLEKVAAAVELNLATILELELCDFPGHVSPEQMRIAPADLIKCVREATNFGLVLRATAISSAGSVDLGQDAANIS
jgi:hypothetical protein